MECTILALITCSLLFLPRDILGYAGITYCFVLCSIGTAKGIWNISNYVSGASIKTPRVGTKAILGTVVCEANFLSGIILCVLMYNTMKRAEDVTALMHYFYFCSGIFVGMCSYYSSVATGLICASISLMDSKDPSLFYKVVALEIIPASVGLIGFILGIVMNSKATVFEPQIV